MTKSLCGLVIAVLAGACAQSVRVITPPEGNPPALQANPVTFTVEFHPRADVATFRATIDPPLLLSGTSGEIDITSSFSQPFAPGGQSSASVNVPESSCSLLTVGCEDERRLRVYADMRQSQPFDSRGHDRRFRVPGSTTPPPPPPPPPSAVTSIAPASGVIGTLVSVAGAGFVANHAVGFGNRTVPTTVVSGSELRFRVPQRTAGNHAVTVAGVSGPPFALTPGTLSPASASLDGQYGSNATLSIALPLAAPPGGVRLTATASPGDVIELPNQGRIDIAAGAVNGTLTASPTDIGSGTLSIAGDGYVSATVPFAISFGMPQCGVRARAQGGVEFVSPPGSNTVVGSLATSEVPGRIETAPGNARAIAQYLAGIAFLDLVNCSQLDFEQGSIPLNNLAFSGDGRFFAADWLHTTQNDGLVAYRLADASQIFSRNTTSTSLNVVIAQDATGTYVFWLTFNGATNRFDLGIHALTGALGMCVYEGAPSNAFTVTMAAGVATVVFTFPASPAQQLRLRADDCTVQN